MVRLLAGLVLDVGAQFVVLHVVEAIAFRFRLRGFRRLGGLVIGLGAESVGGAPC